MLPLPVPSVLPRCGVCDTQGADRAQEEAVDARELLSLPVPCHGGSWPSRDLWTSQASPREASGAGGLPIQAAP